MRNRNDDVESGKMFILDPKIGGRLLDHKRDAAM